MMKTSINYINKNNLDSRKQQLHKKKENACVAEKKNQLIAVKHNLSTFKLFFSFLKIIESADKNDTKNPFFYEKHKITKCAVQETNMCIFRL